MSIIHENSKTSVQKTLYLLRQTKNSMLNKYKNRQSYK